MEFNTETKKKLKELICFYMNKEIDEEYIKLFIKVINDGLVLPEKIISKSVDERTMGIDSNTKELCIKYNIESMKKNISKLYNIQGRKFVPNLNLFYNYYFSFVLIHELSHLYQKLCYKDSISEYSEVNDLYRKIYSSIINFRNIDLLKYYIFHVKYCHERNANIVSANFLVEVFEKTELDCYSKVAQINTFFSNGYYLKKRKVISPVQRTLNYLRIKEKMETIEIPFNVLFEHGFNISDDDYHFLYDELLDSNGVVNYPETIDKIKTLIKRDNSLEKN